jgi:multiple sugar transport system ATP-binding protein
LFDAKSGERLGVLGKPQPTERVGNVTQISRSQ